MATAKKLPSGNWRVQAKVTINGKLVCRSFTNANKKKAELMAKEWQTNLQYVEPTKLNVGQAYERYITSKEKILSPNTIRAYRMMADNYLLSIKNIELDKLTDEQIQIAVNELSATTSPKTVRNAYGMLTAVLKMYRPSFIPHIALPQRQKKEIYIPTRKEISFLLEKTKNENIYVPIILASFCGLREAELCALTDKDIKNNKIHVNKSMVHISGTEWAVKSPKSYSGDRYVEMPEIVSKAILNKQGNIVSYTPNGLRMTFKKALKKYGCKDIRFHDLRHYYVSELFDMGLPEKYIIAQVGHSSATITKAVYDHLSKEKQSEFSRSISSHFDDICNK